MHEGGQSFLRDEVGDNAPDTNYLDPLKWIDPKIEINFVASKAGKAPAVE